LYYFEQNYLLTKEFEGQKSFHTKSKRRSGADDTHWLELKKIKQRMKFGKKTTWLVISKLPENPLEGKRRGKPELFDNLQTRHLPCPQVCFHEISLKNQDKISKG
jgi:hypothetical protein